MEKAPAFQFYPADLLADENFALMSLEARGAYITLICYCWREGSIPADMNRIAKLCGIDSSAMAELWTELYSCFSEANGRYVNPWLERARLKQIEHRKERQESGKKGAESRWEKAKAAQDTPAEGLTPDSSANGSANGSIIAQPSVELMANDASSSSSSSSCINTTKRVRANSPTRKKRKPTHCDEEYLQSLQANPAYSHLNVKACYHKCAAWCEPRGLEPTRLRFIAWLNKEPGPPPESVNSAGDEWAKREIAETVEDLPAPFSYVARDASTDQQRANVLANYNRRIRQARGEVVA